MRVGYKLNAVLALLLALSSSIFASDEDLFQKSRSSSYSSTGSTALTSTESPQSQESYMPYANREDFSPRSDALNEESLMNIEEGVIDPAILNLLEDAKYDKEKMSTYHKSCINDFVNKDILSIICMANGYLSGNDFLKKDILTAIGLYKWIIAQESIGDNWHWQIQAMDHLRSISEKNEYKDATKYWLDNISDTLAMHAGEMEKEFKALMQAAHEEDQ